MKTILTPIDFSAASPGVIAAASKLAEELHARIVLLHSVPPPVIMPDYTGGASLEMMQETVAVTERAAATQLDHVQTALLTRGLRVETALVTGAAAQTIVDHARAVNADYIILGSHGHTALYDLLVGSTTHAVLKHAPCPVVIVPRETAPAK